MVERNDSRMSFWESVSGDVEKLSRSRGVHNIDGSNEESTDSATEDSENLAERMKLKSKVVLEVVDVDNGGHDCGSAIGGDMLPCSSTLSTSERAICVGIALRHCSRTRIRVLRRVRFWMPCCCRNSFIADPIDFEPASSIRQDFSWTTAISKIYCQAKPKTAYRDTTRP